MSSFPFLRNSYFVQSSGRLSVLCFQSPTTHHLHLASLIMVSSLQDLILLLCQPSSFIIYSNTAADISLAITLCMKRATRADQKCSLSVSIKIYLSMGGTHAAKFEFMRPYFKTDMFSCSRAQCVYVCVGGAEFAKIKVHRT